MSASMIHESNVKLLPAVTEYDLESIVMVVGKQTSCVHYDDGEHDCIELVWYRPGEKFPRMILQTDGPMKEKV